MNFMCNRLYISGWKQPSSLLYYKCNAQPTVCYWCWDGHSGNVRANWC